MCFGGDLTEEQKNEQKHSGKISKQLRRDFDEESKEIKILLLGSGGSGKSSFLKKKKKKIINFYFSYI